MYGKINESQERTRAVCVDVFDLERVGAYSLSQDEKYHGIQVVG